MRDDHSLHSPTPQKDVHHHHPRSSTNRRIKYNVERDPKLQKSSRKDSIDVSTLPEVSEDNPVAESTESSRKDSAGISFFWKVSEDNHVAESSESFTTSLSPFDSPSSVHLPSSGITQLSSTNSAATAEPSDLSVSRYGCLQSDSEVAGSLEVELVVKHLQKLMLQSLNSADTDIRYKKLLDGLVKIVIQEFCGVPEERDWLTDIISRRSQMVFLSLIFWILVFSTVFCFSKFAQSSYSGPPPT